MTKKYFAYCLILLVVVNVLLADVSSLVMAADDNHLGTYDQSTNLGIDNDLNLFILSKEKQNNVDSEAWMAVDGNATYSDYALSSGLENNAELEGPSALINVSEDNSPNNEPAVPNYSVTTPEDIELSGKVVGTDKDGDSLTYTKATDPKNGKVEVSEDGTWTYTPNEDYNGEDSFTVEVSNGKGGKAISTIVIVVTPENDEPYTPDYCIRTPEDTPVSGRVEGTDRDGDKLTYRKETDPENGKAEVNEDGTWTYTPNKDYFGKDKFTVEASDGNYEESISTINITVPPVNDDPIVPDYSVTTPENTEVSGIVAGSDIEGDKLTYTKATDPKNGKVEVNEDGTWTYTPNTDYNGKDSFTVEVNDGNGGKAISTITIDVTPVNDMPTVPDYSVTTPEDTPVSGVVTGTDKDGDKLTYTKATDPKNGKVEVNEDGTWTYTPNTDYNGKDGFTVEVNDGNSGKAISTITIDVTPVNDVPTVPDYSVTTPEDTPVSGIVVGTDKDGDSLTYRSITKPTNGTVVDDVYGKWTYTPNLDYNGKDSFKVEVSDGNGGTAISTITIEVTPVNDTKPSKSSTPSKSKKDVIEPIVDIPAAVKEKADFAVLIDASTMRAGVNSTVKYTITYFNKLTTEVPNTSIKVNVPDKMTFIEADNNGKLVENEVVWDIGTLKGNAKDKLSFTLKVKDIEEQESTVTLTAKIYSKDENIELINTKDDESKIDTFLFANESEFTHTRFILGYPDGTVKPKGPVTRAEVAVIFARILKLKDQGYVKGVKVFSDVKVDFWGAEHIEAAAAVGLFKGYKDNTFKPNQPITRAELATVISNYLKITTYPEYTVLAQYFTDISGHWAEANINEIYRYGIIKGYEDNTFRPNNTITREETITMVNQMLHRGPLTKVKPSFPDNLESNWSFGHVEEATNTHKSFYNEDGSETLVEIIPEGIW